MNRLEKEQQAQQNKNTDQMNLNDPESFISKPFLPFG
jgi:hypothetical protein